MRSNRVIQLKDDICPNLSLRSSVDKLFDFINLFKNTNFIIDFNGVETINRTFAQQFLLRQRMSNNNISYINVPYNVKKMFEIVSKPREKTIIANFDSEKAISIK